MGLFVFRNWEHMQGFDRRSARLFGSSPYHAVNNICSGICAERRGKTYHHTCITIPPARSECIPPPSPPPALIIRFLGFHDHRKFHCVQHTQRFYVCYISLFPIFSCCRELSRHGLQCPRWVHLIGAFGPICALWAHMDPSAHNMVSRSPAYRI